MALEDTLRRIGTLPQPSTLGARQVGNVGQRDTMIASTPNATATIGPRQTGTQERSVGSVLESSLASSPEARAAAAGGRPAWQNTNIRPSAPAGTPPGAFGKSFMDRQAGALDSRPSGSWLSDLAAQANPATPTPGSAMARLSQMPTLRADPFGPSDGATRGVAPEVSAMDRLTDMGYRSRPVAGAAGVQRLTGADGRTIYTNDVAGTADWVAGGMRPGVSSVDLNAANASMARANEARAGMADLAAQRDFDVGAALSRQKTNQEIARQMLTSPIGSSRRTGASIIQNQEANQLTRLEQLRRELETVPQVRGQQIQNQAAQAGLDRQNQIDGLVRQYGSTNDPAQRDRIAAQLRLLQGGQDRQNRYITVGGGQEQTDNGLRALPQRLFDTQSGAFVDQPAGQGVLQAPDAAVAALRANPQRAAEFDQKYGVGAASRYLG